MKVISDPHRRPPRNYLARREQWRLLALVMSLGLVVILMAQLRQPEARVLLGRVFGLEDTPPAADSREPDVQADEIAALLKGATAAPLPPGTFRSPLPERLPDHDDEGLLPGVDPELLADVKDNAIFRSAEAPAWVNLLHVLQTTDDVALAAGAVGEPGYAQFIRQPQAYRGRVVTVRGEARQVVPVKPAAGSELGQSELYRIVIKPVGGADWPIMAYCLALPNDFPQRERISETVRLDGLFFKNWSYPAANQFGLAPVLLARRLEWSPAPATDEPARDSLTGMFVGCVAVAAVIAAVLTAFALRRPKTRTTVWLLAIALPIDGMNTVVADDPEATASSPRAVLELAGIGDEQLGAVRDGKSLGDDELDLALKLLYRLHRFDPLDVDRWSQPECDGKAIADDPAAVRATMFALEGTAREVEQVEPPPDMAVRFEVPVYYRVGIDLESFQRPGRSERPGRLASRGWRTIVITPNVPKAWLDVAELNERCSAAALFLKVGESEDGGEENSPLIFLADRAQWHPDDKGTIAVPFGTALLAELGVDVGRFDDIRHRLPLRHEETEVFYQTLAAAGELSAGQLIRAAEGRLGNFAAEWKARTTDRNLDGDAADANNRQKAAQKNRGEPTLTRQIAREVARQEKLGRYSVAPLFRDAAGQVGRLYVVDGVARRAVEVIVDRDRRGEISDIGSRFGIGRYFEMEVFTLDSQDLPLVFCVRELPDGFPIGEEIREDVRVAGFFFKLWRFQSRKPAQGVTARARAASSAGFAPLLIGRAPMYLKIEPAGWRAFAGVVTGGLFVLALLALWWLLRQYARGDREFHRRIIRPGYEPDTAESLNTTGIEAADVPDFSKLDLPKNEP